MSNFIHVLVHDKHWKGLDPTVKRAAEAVFHFLNSPLEGESNRSFNDSVGGEVSKESPHQNAQGHFGSPSGGELKKVALTIVLTDDAEITELNHQYRGKNKPTNVLSFENGGREGEVTQLGDVVMSYDTIAREAEMQKKPIKHHVTHLTIHGVLHLLGFDHESGPDAKIMEALEIKILARMGIANPYETA